MRRSISAVAALAGLALTLTACSSGGDSSDATTSTDSTLTIWVDETRQAAVESAAADFTAETGTQVTTVLKNYDDIRTDFISQVPTGKGPDITVGAHDWLGELTKNGVVAPIELGDLADDFEDVSVEAFTQDGQVYGLPYAVENIALIRNTALAADAPATWDDMIAAGQAAGTQYPALIQTSEEGDPYTYYPLQTSFGAPVFQQNDDGSYNSTLALGGANGEAFASWLAAQGAAGAIDTAITYDIALEAFKNGESPFIISGPWALDSFDGLDLAVSAVPSAGGQEAQPFAGVQGFYVSAQSENALLANDFLLNYMSTEDAQLALYQAGNRLPALTTAAEAAAQDPVTAGFREVGSTAVPMPSIPEMASVWTYWGVTEAAIITGSQEPVAAWQKMVSDIQTAIDG